MNTLARRLLNLYRRRRDRRIRNPGEPDPIRRYRRRYGPHLAVAAFLDGALRAVLGSSTARPIKPPRRILLCNIGGFGDVVLSTAAIGILRRAFPQAEIGFLLEGWATEVLENHPHVDRVHGLTHWQIARCSDPAHVRVARYCRAASRMARELRRCRYDIAIDLRAWSPNSAWVLYRAGIPVRIGYSRLGTGPLYTHPRAYRYQRFHESRIQTDLLRALPIPPEFFDNPPFDMPPPQSAATEETRSLLHASDPHFAGYCVIHAGASTPVRAWPVDRWRELTDRELAAGRVVVFTGAGARDQALIDQIIEGRARCVSVCNRLSWNGLVEIIRRAELVYSVETVTGHIAAALGTPCVAIYGGMSDPFQWAPRSGPASAIVTKPVPCAPCFHYNGCVERPCLSKVAVESVVSAARGVAVFPLA